MATGLLATAAASSRRTGWSRRSRPTGSSWRSSSTDTCRRLKGIPALRPALDLSRATRSGFPGPRGDALALYRILGRLAGRYHLDLWVFYGRGWPTAAQRAAAQRELGGVRWPAWL